MKTAVKLDLKSKTFTVSKSYTLLREKEISLFNNKSYQKLLIVFIALSTFLILPETPKELENICVKYHSRKACNVG